MEAVMKIEDETKREISINVRNINSFISIEAENYYDGEVKTDDSGYARHYKKEQGLSRLRPQIGQPVVEKYGGDLRISPTEIYFRCAYFSPFRINDFKYIYSGVKYHRVELRKAIH